jgi:hypothetical protein
VESVTLTYTILKPEEIEGFLTLGGVGEGRRVQGSQQGEGRVQMSADSWFLDSNGKMV